MDKIFHFDFATISKIGDHPENVFAFYLSIFTYHFHTKILFSITYFHISQHEATGKSEGTMEKYFQNAEAYVLYGDF